MIDLFPQAINMNNDNMSVVYLIACAIDPLH